MMNALGLFLVVSSLVAAGVLSPIPGKRQEDVAVKEAHRVIVVEYDHDGQHNTKVSVSSSPIKGQQGISENTKEMDQESISVLPNLGQGISQPKSDGQIHTRGGEIVYDAVGKGTRKIASAIGKANEQVARVAQEELSQKKEMALGAKHKVSETVRNAKDVVGDALGNVKENLANKAHHIRESTQDSLDKATETLAQKAHDVKEKTEASVDKAKETVEQKSHDIREGTKESFNKAKETVAQKTDGIKENTEELVDKAKEAAAPKAHDARENTKEFLDKEKETAAQKTHATKSGAWETAKGTVKTTKDTGKTLRGDIVSNITKGIAYAAKSVKSGTHRSTDAVRYMCSADSLNSLVSVVNLLGLAAAYGMCVWVTFISSYVLAGALPGGQFGVVQSKIYPVYFRAMSSSVAAALLGHLLGQGRKSFTSKAEMFQVYNLLASLLMLLANSVFLEPRATKVMFERMKLEKEEGRERESFVPQPNREAQSSSMTDHEAETVSRGARPLPTPKITEQEAVRSQIGRLSRTLKRLNSYSSFLNILTLMALTWHLVYLSQRLHMTC